MNELIKNVINFFTGIFGFLTTLSIYNYLESFKNPFIKYLFTLFIFLIYIYLVQDIYQIFIGIIGFTGGLIGYEYFKKLKSPLLKYSIIIFIILLCINSIL